MIPYFTTFLLAWQTCLDGVQAFEHVEATQAAGGEHSSISPALSPKKDAKFFGKDYPWDKRPAVDVLHFKHPYPAVQDSDDFDKDYVKDENSDDGSFAAQSEYDRLRHKLAKEKADVAKASHKKEHAEKELQDALRREREARAKAFAPKPKTGTVQGSKGEVSNEPRQEPEEEPDAKVPGGVASPGDVKVATAETKKAMDRLEECKKELAEARNKLKKLMEELQEAKQKQSETQAALDAAIVRQKELDAGEDASGKAVKLQYQQYMDARNAYLKQQAVLAKMEADIKVAATKVKAFRDAEDRGGGVYNTNSGKDEHGFPLPLKSSAHSSGTRLSALLLMASAMIYYVVN